MRRTESRPIALPRAARQPSAVSRRMLALVAIAGAATLLAACATPGGAPSASPVAPSSAAGAAPVALGDERLQAPGLFDEVSDDGFAVRWAEAGGPLAVVIGGSGGGGGCIPQPTAAQLDDDGVVVVRFDPPDPAIMCTADFRLHGWELGLPSGIEADAVDSVRLENLRGEGETTEVEIGPDGLLNSGPTADPQPSLLPGTPPEGAGEPTPLPDTQLLAAEGELDPMLGAQGDPVVTARWIEPGRTIAVLLGGSGAAPCVPTPLAAWSSGIGTVEVSFEAPSGDMDCSADFQVYGWSFPLGEAAPATLPVEVTLTGLTRDGEPVVLSLAPEQVLPAP